MEKFYDRHEAGKLLAEKLLNYKNDKNLIVLALPRGGVPVAFEIAKKLYALLDVFVVRKLGAPGHEELAIGSLAHGGQIFLNQQMISQLNIGDDFINKVILKESEELKRREEKYRKNRVFPELIAKTIILVDDGIATGATMRMAVQVIRSYQPKKIIVATPVAEFFVLENLAQYVDEIVCLKNPKQFHAVGEWYENFSQTTDEEVISLLEKKL